ncbi:MAG: excinuclease ABC subunit UvrA, partial [Eubacterium sp.]|nr:excinuclease ABC subunit UvrA [Eubacterium sp.]
MPAKKSNDNKKMIRIRGAKEHNLKNISLEIPRDEFVVLTGLSGSGKSSLAFDTIYAEGQRRYMESLSSYARQFLGQMEKPDVESIEGLPPAISIDQKTTNRNPRSTVGTVTEIYDYFRLLYARVGTPHCPNCGKPIEKQTVDQIVDELMRLPEGTRMSLLAPVVRGRKGRHEKVLDRAKKSGYVRVRVDGSLYDLTEEITLDKNIKHNIDIVVDRLKIREGIEKRMTDSIENVMKIADGLMTVEILPDKIKNNEPEPAGADDLNRSVGKGTNESYELHFSQSFSCADCGISIDEIEPRSFSFNNPFGACPVCNGLGFKMEFDEELIIPDPTLSIKEGCIVAPGWASVVKEDSYSRCMLEGVAGAYGFDLDTPWEDYPKKIHDVLWYGTGDRRVDVSYESRNGRGQYHVAFDGIFTNIKQRYRETSSDWARQEYEALMQITPCDECGGRRLKPESLAVTIGDRNISELCDMPIMKLKTFMDEVELTDRQKQIGRLILKEIRSRLGFLVDVGLDYLNLSRATGTLSGGEAQRIRLATQIGSGLVGVAYILDEPSIGLHQRDNSKLIATLKKLRDLGNTLIVVEHDEETMMAADHIVDIGPGAGSHGGEVVAEGTASDIMKNKMSITGKYLSHKLEIPVPEKRRKPNDYLTIQGAAVNNLKNIDVKIPIGIMTCVTGVSGSGKSSLINEILC